MTITTTIQQKKSIEIQIPSFYERTSGSITEALGIFSEQDVIKIFHSNNHTNMLSTPVEHSESIIATAVEDWQSTTEERFFQIHAEAMNKLTILPTLKKEEI